MSSRDGTPAGQDILRSRVKIAGIARMSSKVGELTNKLFEVGVRNARSGPTALKTSPLW